MKKIVSETIDGSIKNIIQLKTLDASLEYSQLFDALEDCPQEFQSKLIGALNSLGETMQIPPTEAFNKVLCKSDENEDVKKRLYNWWRAVFEVLSQCKIPDDRVEEYNQKVDDLMAEILKAGDGEATAEEEPEDVFAEEYEPASMEDEAKMLENMDFAIQELGEIATKVQVLVNFVNPYCGTEVNESMMKLKFKVGDMVKVVGRDLASKGWIGVVSSVDKSSPGLPYTVDFAGRESGEYAPEELAPAKGFTEEEKNTMKFKKIDERIGGGSDDEWLSEKDIIGMKVSGESSLENELDKGDDGWTTIGQPVGEANDFITPEMKEKVREYVMQTWMASQGNDRNRISARDLYQLSKFLVNNHIKVSYGGISDDDSIRIDGEKVGEVVRNYSSRKVNGGYKELRPKIQWLDGGMVNEAKVVVDANDVWDVLELLDNDIAHKELTDLINSHVRTEEEIMDAIDELCGETVTKKELNTLLSGRMATLVDYLGLDVEQYESNGEFVEEGKPTSVELESDDMRSGWEKLDAVEFCDWMMDYSGTFTAASGIRIENATPRGDDEIAVDLSYAKKNADIGKFVDSLLRKVANWRFDGKIEPERDEDGSWHCEIKLTKSGRDSFVKLESVEAGETKKVSLYVDWDDDGAGLDSNVVIDVPAEIADSEESDALYDYIMDWIDHQDFCVNDWAITDIEGLDKVDEGPEEVKKPEEVKSQDKTFNQDGENKTLVTGEEKKKEMSDAEAATIMGGASATDMDAADMGISSHKVADPYKKKPVCEMTIEQDITHATDLLPLLWGQGKKNLEAILASQHSDDEEGDVFIVDTLEKMGFRKLSDIQNAFTFDFQSILKALGYDVNAWNETGEILRSDEWKE